MKKIMRWTNTVSQYDEEQYIHTSEKATGLSSILPTSEVEDLAELYYANANPHTGQLGF
jgi:hypothetical protein